jgi:hypothetical protein
VSASDMHADAFYPKGAIETLTATPNPGFFFKGFSGNLSTSTNGASITLEAPSTVAADFVAQKILTINWATPAPILFGSALGPQQLNASLAGIPGTFAYSPAAGFVPPVGNGFPLSVTFTPTDPVYAVATASVKIEVLPAGRRDPVSHQNSDAAIRYERYPDYSYDFQHRECHRKQRFDK